MDGWIKIGKITNKIKNKIEKILDKSVTYFQLYEKIYNLFKEENVDLAFPINISSNSIAAHDTADINDNRLIEGVVKIDIGGNLNGYLSDTAITVDLDGKYEDLVNTCKEILEKVEEKLKCGIKIREIGKIVEEEAKKKGYKPIYNLYGHKIDRYVLHSNLSIPNYDNRDNRVVKDGIYAIEIFITNGKGYVKDYGYAKIFQLYKKPRNLIARKYYQEIYEDRKNLPFDLYYLYKKYGNKYRIVLNLLRRELIEYPPLKEVSEGIVVQFENTYMIKKDEVIRLT